MRGFEESEDMRKERVGFTDSTRVLSGHRSVVVHNYFVHAKDCKSTANLKLVRID